MFSRYRSLADVSEAHRRAALVSNDDVAVFRPEKIWSFALIESGLRVPLENFPLARYVVLPSACARLPD